MYDEELKKILPRVKGVEPVFYPRDILCKVCGFAVFRCSERLFRGETGWVKKLIWYNGTQAQEGEVGWCPQCCNSLGAGLTNCDLTGALK